MKSEHEMGLMAEIEWAVNKKRAERLEELQYLWEKTFTETSCPVTMIDSYTIEIDGWQFSFLRSLPNPFRSVWHMRERNGLWQEVSSVMDVLRVMTWEDATNEQAR